VTANLVPVPSDEPGVRTWKHTQKTDLEFSMWEGGIDDLRRLAGTVEDMARKHPVSGDGPEASSDRRDWKVSAVAAHEDESTEGAPSAVFDRIDRRTLRGIALDAGRRPYSDQGALHVELERRKGVKIHIESDDRGWFLEAEDRLTREVKRCMPRAAAFTRNQQRMQLSIYAVIVLLVEVLMSKFHVDWVTRIWTAPVLAIIVSFGAAHYATRLVPAFELVGPNGVGTGRRRLAVIGTLTLFLLGVLATVLVAVLVGSSKG